VEGLGFQHPGQLVPPNFRVGFTGLSTTVEASTSGSYLSSKGGLPFDAQTIVIINNHGQLNVGYEVNTGNV
jgi:hypothetical protein